MSGIAGLFRRDGAVIEPQRLHAMAQRLAVRGPDSRQLWTSGPFGLVHTHLATDSRPSDHPFSLDGQVWVTADARIDARSDLIASLGLRRDVSADASDAELIWHAYQRWGAACAEHLLGDFAFIIVDLKASRLVAARDQLGVKPLFYAAGDDWIIVSNLLDCVSQYEPVDTRLNDLFILDFLMHGWKADATSTAFQSISRLAPAHVLTCTPDNAQLRRYWELNIPPEDRRTSSADHVAKFSELFEQAVSDRLRGQPACITFSGGKDSTTVAATAMRLLSGHSSQPALHGISVVYDRIIPDQERHFATLAAQRLGLPLEFIVGDDLPALAPDWDVPSSQTPEPSRRAIPVHQQVLAQAAGHSRIVLSGFGGDEALRPAIRYYQKLLHERRWGRFALDCIRHLAILRSLPPVGLRTLLYKNAWLHMTGKQKTPLSIPAWLNPDLVRQYALRDRWEQFWQDDISLTDSRKPGGYKALVTSAVAHSAGDYDVAAMRAGVEYRFPYLDLRVIGHLWSIPPIPLRFEKHILQSAFSGKLPQEVLNRRKQGLAGDPLREKPIRIPHTWDECVARTPDLLRYVATNPAPGGDFTRLNPRDLWAALSPFELETWMHNRWRILP